MHVKTFRVRNFRRLRQVAVDLDYDTTVFVGANNSGKTSAHCPKHPDDLPVIEWYWSGLVSVG